MYEYNFPTRRYNLTLNFVKKYISKNEEIFDLGVKNPLSDLLKSNGYTVTNTNGEDLDFDCSSIQNSKADVVTAFEIFEHLVSPFVVLKEIKANKLIASVPLKLWFSKSTSYQLTGINPLSSIEVCHCFK